jgi:DNA-binding winged helix-turn-helix (wHTH) protein
MRLSFEGCVFDSDTREVLRGGNEIALSPKAFLLLEILIRDSPKAVSKESIHRQLWPATFVSDANLPNLVAELRAALGDDAKKPRIVRTVHRFGYAFAADAAAAPEKAPARSPAPFTCRLVWGPREIALDPGENLIGRDRDSVVWIDDASVSRRHARICLDDSGATVEDLGSKNGTFLHGRRIGKPARLADKDAIKIGPASMIFRLFKRIGSTASTIEERERA